MICTPLRVSSIRYPLKRLRSLYLRLMLKPTIFREYDIRGVADEELLDPGITELGRALGTLLQRRAGKNINLARDCRLSSPRLRDALLKGLSRHRLRCDRYRHRAHPAAVLLRVPSESRRRNHDYRQPQSDATITASK